MHSRIRNFNVWILKSIVNGTSAPPSNVVKDSCILMEVSNLNDT